MGYYYGNNYYTPRLFWQQNRKEIEFMMTWIMIDDAYLLFELIDFLNFGYE